MSSAGTWWITKLKLLLGCLPPTIGRYQLWFLNSNTHKSFKMLITASSACGLWEQNSSLSVSRVSSFAFLLKFMPPNIRSPDSIERRFFAFSRKAQIVYWVQTGVDGLLVPVENIKFFGRQCFQVHAEEVVRYSVRFEETAKDVEFVVLLDVIESEFAQFEFFFFDVGLGIKVCNFFYQIECHFEITR